MCGLKVTLGYKQVAYPQDSNIDAETTLDHMLSMDSHMAAGKPLTPSFSSHKSHRMTCRTGHYNPSAQHTQLQRLGTVAAPANMAGSGSGHHRSSPLSWLRSMAPT
jgi:hypothetical protein